MKPVVGDKPELDPVEQFISDMTGNMVGLAKGGNGLRFPWSD